MNGGSRNRKNRSFGRNSKAGEKSAENFRPKISPEKTFSSKEKSKTSPEEKPLFSITLFVISKAKTRTKKIKITEKQIPKALLKSRKKTPPFLLKKDWRFFFFYSPNISAIAFPRSIAEYCASSRVFPLAPISIKRSPGERSILYFR